MNYLLELLNRVGSTPPDDPLLLFEARRLPVGAISTVASETAAWLEQCLDADDRVVGLCSPDPWLTVRMQLGCMWAGLTLYPIDAGIGGEQRDALFRQAGSRHLVTGDTGHTPSLSTGGDASPRPAGHAPAHRARGRSELDRIALLVSTSGTSGHRKGVMLSYGNLFASVAASRRRLGLSRGDLWLNALPLHHIGGLAILYRCLEAGAGMLLHRRFEADNVWRDLQSRPVTHISLVPAMLSLLLDRAEGSRAPRSLKCVLVGGDALDPGLRQRARRSGWPVCVTYGMTETCSQLATFCGDPGMHSPGYVGRALEGFDLALSPGEGRIRVRGEAVMEGYANPGLEPGDGLDGGWFETGDLGSIGPDGGLTILGRADDCLTSGGKTVHPLEIERRLAVCPGVDSVAVAGRPDPVWGDLVVALFTGEGTPEEVEQWGRRHLPGPMRPREFVSVGTLPRNEMGKVDRRALRAWIATRRHS